MQSHPAWVCGLKLAIQDMDKSLAFVTPCVGVWIETLKFQCLELPVDCHTLRGCVDWNLPCYKRTSQLHVTPCVGVWIETFTNLRLTGSHLVTPCVGVWIETLLLLLNGSSLLSHPAWVCGLKLWLRHNIKIRWRHTLRGCVDWNYHRVWVVRLWTVTPCVGVWIETSVMPSITVDCVVTPCVGVWIETIIGLEPYRPESSHPAWVCGLKQD